jgi:hypothetical protein
VPCEEWTGGEAALVCTCPDLALLRSLPHRVGSRVLPREHLACRSAAPAGPASDAP